MAITRIITPSITDDAVDNTKLDLASNYTFTGTVSGVDGKFESQLLHIQDQKAPGTFGGTDVAGYQTRDLNTVLTNQISGASLSSNQITLPSGTFYIQASTVAYATGTCRIKLTNVTDSSNTLYGLNGQVGYTTAVAPRYFLNGRFTIASSKSFRIEQYVQNATNSNLGNTIGDGFVEIYTDVQIWKVA
jgi:hypothetical protein